MNILILNWRDPKNPLSGGAEIVTMEHAKAWVKAGHKVIWFTSAFTGSLPKEEISGVTLVRRGRQIGKLLTLYLWAPFFYLFSGQKFDIVIDEIHGIPFFTPLYVSVPKIAFIHEIAGEIWDYMYPTPLNLLGRLCENIMFHLYCNITFWTDAPSTVEELTERGIPAQNCIAIPCPIINSPLSKLPPKEKHPTFICVSRLVKMKGLENVLIAFSLIAKSTKLARLWIVGDGSASYFEELRTQARNLRIANKVTFWGRVSEARKIQLLRRAHLLLHASTKEGWGLVVLEAASQGTPSVVYDVAGLRDTVKDNQTGILTTYNTPEELARETQGLLADKRKYKRLQKNALIWSKSFTWTQATKQSLTLLGKVYGK